MKKRVTDKGRLLAKLESKSPKIRDTAALEVMRLKIKGGKVALLAAALNPKNMRYTGTLVYALQAFDCSKEFGDIFDLALFGSYEVRCMALAILESKGLAPSLQDVRVCEFKLASIKGSEFQISDKEELVGDLEKVLRSAKRTKRL